MLQRISLFILLSVVLACGDSGTSDTGGGTTADVDPTGGGDVETTTGGDAETTTGGETTGGETTGGETTGGGEDDVMCETTLSQPDAGTCHVTPGSQTLVAIRGDIMTPTGRLFGGEVVIDRQSGTILCTACDCSAERGDATRLDCPTALVTPGLINNHDHLGWAQHPPVDHGTERYDHRHEWRKGKNGKTKLSTPSNLDKTLGESWGELRMVMGGSTSMMGSGGKDGLTRNLDRNKLFEGIPGHGQPNAPTFPLGDTGGTMTAEGCGNYELKGLESRKSAVAYIPHVAEGVVDAAHNEFKCMSGQVPGSEDLVMENAAFIHGIGVTTSDIALMAADSTGLVWSPRSNVSLYGFTAEVGIYDRQGVLISLGSDWAPSGSINLLRELACADYLNQNHMAGYFTDRDLVLMVTHNAAELAGFADVLGTLQVGKLADVTIWDGSVNPGYRAVLDANVNDVALVLRGGEALYGDTPLIDALAANDACDAIDVCGTAKRACISREIGVSWDALVSAVDKPGAYKNYPAYFCGVPDNEPTCVPSRPNEFSGSSTSDDPDGDGLTGDADNCPTWFNPPRPMDDGAQPDVDNDGLGDACDPCPFDADTEACTSIDPNDLDGDGVSNLADNCPAVANADQANGDGDLAGDACDACPEFKDPCPGNVYAIKKGETADGTPLSMPPMVITAIASNGYWVQLPAGAETYDGPEYSGIFVFDQDGAATLAIGQTVAISATTGNYFGQLQLTSPSKVEVLMDQNVIEPVLVDPADVATGGAKDEAFEGVMVRVENVTVLELEPTTTETAPTGEFLVTGNLLVDDLLHVVGPELGEVIEGITGVMRFGWENYKLTPRSAEDLKLGPPQLAVFGPPLVYVDEGVTGSTSPALMLELSGPAEEEVTVTIESAQPDAVAPVAATYVFAIGEQFKEVEVAALAQSVPVTFTATSNGKTFFADVRVVGTDEIPAVVSIDPPLPTLLVGKDLTLTVMLDLPAKGAQVVTLSANPEGMIELPESITIADGEFIGSFDVSALANEGTVSVTAAAGGAMVQAEITIIELEPVGLILVEVYYDATGSDDGAEWIKLYNGTLGEVDLSGYSLGYGGANYAWGKVQLAGTVAAGECFVVGGPLSDAGNGSPTLGQSMNFEPDIQNSGSAADGIALFDVPASSITATTVPIDAVIYGGENSANLLDESGGPGNVDVGDANGGSSIARSFEGWAISEPNAVSCPAF